MADTTAQNRVIEVLNQSGKKELAEKIKEMFTECSSCNAKCCKYIIFEILDLEYTYLQYLIYHGVSLFLDTANKTIDSIIMSTCSKLDDQGNCTVYDTRPDICKDHAEIVCFEAKKNLEGVTIISTEEEMEKHKNEILEIIRSSNES